MGKKIPVVAYDGNKARDIGEVTVEGTPPPTMQVASDELEGGEQTGVYSPSMNEYSIDKK